MITYFPKPYEDELAYSLFARFYMKSGYTTLRDVMDVLYVNKWYRADTLFFNKLKLEVVDIITQNISMKEFVERHTMFPYYARFIKKERREKAVQSMINMDGNYHNLLPIPNCIHGRYLRYCPDCVKYDRENHGEYTSFVDFVVRMLRTKDKISESQLSKLIDAGAFDSLYPNRKSLKMSIPNAIQYAQNTLFEEGKLLNDFGIKFEMFEAYDDPIDRINNEVEALGVMISDSPLNHIDKNILNAHKITQIDNLKMNVESEILAIVRSIKSIVVKNGKDKGKPMAFLTVFDESDELDVTIFSSLWADYVTEIKENSILLIKGKAEIRNSKPSMIAREIKVIEG